MKNKKILELCLFIALLILYYILNKIFNFSIPCIFHKLTNFYCPGCGITRMFFSLLEGNITKAFHYNALVFIFLVMLVIYVILKFLFYINNKQIKIPNYIYYISLVIAIIFGVIRNFELFSFLAP